MKKNTKYIFIIGIILVVFFFYGDKKTDGESCIVESTCGSDGYIGSPYCQGDNVVQDYIDFSCDGAGYYVTFRTESLDYGGGVGVAYAPSGCGTALFRYGATGGGCTQYNCETGTDYTMLAPGGNKFWYVSTDYVCICDNNPTSLPRRYTASDNDADDVSASTSPINPSLEIPCTEAGTCHSTVTTNTLQSCQEGCDNGECYTAACDEETDCGVDGYIGSPYCNGDYLVQDYRDHTCQYPGTVSAQCVYTDTQYEIDNCAHGCSFGECNDPPFCNSVDDPACGSDYYTGQYYCVGDLLVQDYVDNFCANPGTQSSECDSTTTQSTVQSCAYGCEGTACLGEPDCHSDGDCGVDGYIGTYFCQTGDVYQDYETYTCNSPGTQSASCSVMIDPQMIIDCDFGCESGACTFPVECSLDGDCGSDETSQPYCDSGNVYTTFTDFTCLNPGAYNSRCDSSTSESLDTQCTGYGCKNAICCNTVADEEQCDGQISNTEIEDAGDNWISGIVSRTELGKAIMMWAG